MFLDSLTILFVLDELVLVAMDFLRHLGTLQVGPPVKTHHIHRFLGMQSDPDLFAALSSPHNVMSLLPPLLNLTTSLWLWV
jgi:hypothetical protein